MVRVLQNPNKPNRTEPKPNPKLNRNAQAYSQCIRIGMVSNLS